MRILFSYKHMDSSDALSEFAEKKIQEKIERYSTKPIEAHITFSVNNHIHLAQLSVKGGDGFNLQVEGSSKDMYESVDLLVSKLEGQLRRKKEKLKNHKFRDNIRKLKPLAPSSKWEDSGEIDAEDVIKYEKARKLKVNG